MKRPASRFLSIMAAGLLALSTATCRMEDAPEGGGGPVSTLPLLDGPAPGESGLTDVSDITPGRDFYMSPVWSPDGRWIALTTAGYRGIVLVSPEGGTVVNVTEDPAAGYKPSWAPDGKSLAYLVSRVEGGARLRAVAVYDIDRGEEKVLTGFQPDTGFPVFSRDGKSLLVTMAGKLVRVEALRGAISEVAAPTGARYVQVAGKAGTAVLDEGLEVAAVNLADGARTVLFSGDGFFNPVLSPDEKKILVYESRGAEGRIWVCGLKGEGKRDLGPGYGAKFHPGGDWIVLEDLENDSLRFTAGDLWAVNEARGTRVRLTDTLEVIEMYPDFSHDGTRIAYTDAATGRVFVAGVAFKAEGGGEE